MGILCPRGTGSIPAVTSSLVWDGSQWRDSVSSARVDPALNGYLEKSGEGKQEGCVKAQDGWPHPPIKGHETEISNAGLDLKGLVQSYLIDQVMKIQSSKPVLPALNKVGIPFQEA